jgi:formylglycine-generating enzyme required for sulfatase activity
MTWYDAQQELDKEGKRLCLSKEWTFACEGPEMHPYPYGDGYHRDNDACNFNNPLPPLSVFAQDNKQKRLLDAFLVPSGVKPLCVSPFGVRDQVGNIDEFVVNESGKPYKSSLMGGHFLGVRNNCRAQTTAHSELFSWYESGTRGCKDVNK